MALHFYIILVFVKSWTKRKNYLKLQTKKRKKNYLIVFYITNNPNNYLPSLNKSSYVNDWWRNIIETL